MHLTSLFTFLQIGCCLSPFVRKLKTSYYSTCLSFFREEGADAKLCMMIMDEVIVQYLIVCNSCELNRASICFQIKFAEHFTIEASSVQFHSMLALNSIGIVACDSTGLNKNNYGVRLPTQYRTPCKNTHSCTDTVDVQVVDSHRQMMRDVRQVRCCHFQQRISMTEMTAPRITTANRSTLLRCRRLASTGAIVTRITLCVFALTLPWVLIVTLVRIFAFN